MARAETLTFVQDPTVGTPGFEASATITIAGGGTPADLPTLSNFNNPGPYDFAPLTALMIAFPSVPNLGPYTLADFTAAATMFPNFGFPAWSISPSDVTFFNRADAEAFDIMGFGALAAPITFATDLGGLCGGGSACTAFGGWEPVPEPGSAASSIAALTFLTIGWAAGRGRAECTARAKAPRRGRRGRGR